MNCSRAVRAGLLCVAASFAGCGSGEPKKPIDIEPVVTRDVHPMLRGTIGAEITFRNVDPVLVSGLGLVVGLHGTGGQMLPEDVAATMEREMGLQGIGRGNQYSAKSIDAKSPREVLRDPNVAVVIVQAAIPPGLPKDATFDVYVRALNATSLEGGTLWSTPLRIGNPTTFGGVQTTQLATARGAVFINPFAERGKETDGVTQTVGRVLAGGRASSPLPIQMVMDNASHARARAIVSAVNTRFPPLPGDQCETARGRSASNIELRVPAAYRDRAGDFIELVAHLPVDFSFVEERARRIVEAVKAEPALAEEAAWSLESLGPKALPFIRELYDFPEIAPRMAALKAGARLNDARAAGPLREVARTASGGVRTQAISFLADLDGGPTVDIALRDLAAESELTVRVAAYEALVRRAVRVQAARYRAAIESDPDAARPSPTRLETLAADRLPGGTVQGVRRALVGDKFLLDVVPFGEPLIYVSQQGRPRVVLFGAHLGLTRASVVSVWNDRFMLETPGGQDRVRVVYRPPAMDRGYKLDAPAGLPEFVQFLAHDTTPEKPDAGLSMTYSDVVGVLSALVSQKALPAAFATEQDRLRSQLLAAAESRAGSERPEKPGEEPVVLFRPAALEPAASPTEATPPKIVPITPVDPKAEPKK